MAGYHRLPREEIRELAAAAHMRLNEAELDFVAEVVRQSGAVYERLDELPEPEPGIAYDGRDPGHRPDEAADPYNAFVRRCTVEGADGGPLSGTTVGLKDNVAVAGVEMTAGSTVLEGYVPETDATVVGHLLDAGATITGKTNQSPMTYFDLSVGERSATGPVRNPRDPDRSPGGSSSGSAVAVVDGAVDVALGTDQGGSVRTPASWCGCVGLKPTWGLVPYTGIMSMDDTLDHVGPLAPSVEGCARVLDAIAGPDPADPRQDPSVDVRDYAAAVPGDPEDLTVGVLGEAFDVAALDPDVRDAVEAAIDDFEAMGATLRDVSVPMATDGAVIWAAIATEGFAAKLRADGLGHFRDGTYDRQLAVAFGAARRAHADDLPLPVKASFVLGNYLAEAYQGRYYAKAQNLGRELSRAYDDAFETVDVLAMPTTASVARPIPGEVTPADAVDRLAAKGETDAVRSQFNVTGHPAISVPCGRVEGLPVGLQLVGPRFRDDLVLAAAGAFEAGTDWSTT